MASTVFGQSGPTPYTNPYGTPQKSTAQTSGFLGGSLNNSGTIGNGQVNLTPTAPTPQERGNSLFSGGNTSGILSTPSPYGIQPSTNLNIPGVPSSAVNNITPQMQRIMDTASSLQKTPAQKPAQAGAMTPTQQTQQQHNAALMTQYGPGNYTIDANGNVLPRQVAGSQQTVAQATPEQQLDTQASQWRANNPAMSNQSNVSQSPVATDYGSVVQGLINTSTQQNPTVDAAQKGLLDTSKPSADYTAAQQALMSKSQGPTQEYQNATANANAYNDDLKQSRINEAKGLTSNASNPIPLEFQMGRSAFLQNQYGLEQSALGQAYNAATAQQGQANTQQGLEQSGIASAGGLANTQQGLQQSGYSSAGGLAQSQQQLQQSGLGTAAGLIQPVGQFGMLTNPVTGQPLNTQLFQGAVAQASQLVKNGADPEGQAVQSLLSPFGFVGQLAFNNAQGVLGGSGYNPTVQSTQAQTNASQGASYQQQAVALDTGLKQLSLITPVATTFLTQSGINPSDTALYNTPINEYLSKLGNTGAVKQWAGIVNDINKYASQILAAGSGGIPTDVSNAMSSVDVSTLNTNQLKGYLDTLDALGKNQLSVLQNQKGNLYGNTGGYSGNSADSVGSISVISPNTSMGSGVTNPTAQGAAGVGLGIASWLQSQVANLGPKIVSFIGGLLTGEALPK